MNGCYVRYAMTFDSFVDFDLDQYGKYSVTMKTEEGNVTVNTWSDLRKLLKTVK